MNIVTKLRKDSKVELLEKVPLFEQCSRRELGRIAALAEEVDVDEGKALTTENDRGREFFVLVEGSADVHRRGRHVNTLGPGDFLGEIALLGERPRTATVTATAPSKVLVLSRRDFRWLLQDVPTLPVKVLEAVAERVTAA
jgi:CRP/FNR family cyclic AMP-dependent transcriptional regulator